VLVFNGGLDWQVLHGVDNIEADTCPEYLPQLETFRISLQFREVVTIDKRVREKLN
jgi:hypothetical protein